MSDTQITAKKIFCFGDSLTKGYYEQGYNYAPYSDYLKQMIADHLQDEGIQNQKFEICHSAENGERTDHMIKRLEKELKSMDVKPQFVVILAGLNDLPDVTPSADADSKSRGIGKRVALLNEIALNCGAKKTFCCLIPSCEPDSIFDFE